MGKIHIPFMKVALREARKGLGRTSPNPAVGAVLVRDGRIIAKGYHRRAGSPHAEVEVLRQVGRCLPGDTLYVTLEPCNHYGRTPPCTEAILRSGVRRVVVGKKDPNPQVVGGGCDILAQQGVEVITGILEEECQRLNEAYVTFCLKGRPFVIFKSSLTLDGWSATSTGHSTWVTGEKARLRVHRMRDQVDGIMVGVGTVLADNPRLTTRLPHRRGKDPHRIVVDTHLRTPKEARILRADSPAKTYLVVGSEVEEHRCRSFQTAQVEVIRCSTREGRIDLRRLMDILARMGFCSLLVEGGATLGGSLYREGLIDKYCIFKAGKLLGGDDGVPMLRGKGPVDMGHCLRLRDMRVRRFGEDFMVTGYPARGVREEG